MVFNSSSRIAGYIIRARLHERPSEEDEELCITLQENIVLHFFWGKAGLGERLKKPMSNL